jgi:hypothetical protein
VISWRLYDHGVVIGTGIAADQRGLGEQIGALLATAPLASIAVGTLRLEINR